MKVEVREKVEEKVEEEEEEEEEEERGSTIGLLPEAFQVSNDPGFPTTLSLLHKG